MFKVFLLNQSFVKLPSTFTTIFLICLLFGSCDNSAVKNNKEKSIKNADEELFRIVSARKDSLFQAYIEKIFEKPEDKKYISDITSLKSIQLINCDSLRIVYSDSVDHFHVELELSIKKFDKNGHNIEYKEGYENCKLIDGNEPWGGFYGCPETEVEDINVKINGNKIDIKDQLTDMFDFQMCNSDYRHFFNPAPLLKYDDKNKVFYLYVKGGNAANNYFGKVVFNENGFIGRYMMNYIQLSRTSSFKPDFKGF
jgi:hypothetical protein